jgi:dihydropteroate synthase
MQLNCNGKQLNLGRCRVMGILNTTPDSFSDGGKFTVLDTARLQVERMLQEGADIIDVGGESTRPGAQAVSEQQELDRVIPLIEAIKQDSDVIVSIDTSKAGVMREAVNAGAGMINDVCALTLEGSLETAASLNIPVCLMHMQGTPRSMQTDPQYDDVTQDVKAFLMQRVNACEAAGIARDSIILDPGFGFGKTLAHNLQLLRELGVLLESGLPVLVGLSRKSMIDKLLNLPVDERLAATIALETIAVEKGAKIIRAHDVKEAVHAARIAEAVSDQS